MSNKKLRRKRDRRPRRQIAGISLGLIIGLGLGGFVGYQAGVHRGGDSAVGGDSYGRSSSDPHYGHDHP